MKDYLTACFQLVSENDDHSDLTELTCGVECHKDLFGPFYVSGLCDQSANSD